MDPTITTTYNNNNHHHKPTTTTTTTTTTSFLNGKKHQTIKHPHPYPHPLYRECLRNHAAALGGHAVDGCGEFMPSNSGSPTCGPSSLTCAACGCHRNFHRRLDRPLLLLPAEEDHRRSSSSSSSSGDDDDDDDGGEEGHSGPHMLLALSTGVGPTGSNNGGGGNGTAMGAPVCPPAMPERRKRFRSRFSPEQKGKMQELSERLGWRMQRRDEGIIEKGCREIGIGRGVFKVWMHNNKHNYASANAANADANAANGGGGESPACMN